MNWLWIRRCHESAAWSSSEGTRSLDRHGSIVTIEEGDSHSTTCSTSETPRLTRVPLEFCSPHVAGPSGALAGTLRLELRACSDRPCPWLGRNRSYRHVIRSVLIGEALENTLLRAARPASAAGAAILSAGSR